VFFTFLFISILYFIDIFLILFCSFLKFVYFYFIILLVGSEESRGKKCQNRGKQLKNGQKSRQIRAKITASNFFIFCH